MADNILFLNMSLVSSKCLFEVWVFNKDVTDDKIAMMVQKYNRGARSIEV